jgi:hypothetical protein
MKVRSNATLALSVIVGLGSFAGMTLLGERTFEAIVASTVASLGAAFIVVLVVERPIAAFAVLLGLASVSGVVIGLPFGRVRLEQPAIIAALVTILVTRSWPRPSDLKPMLPLMAAFGVYLAVLVLASALHAPQPLVSARLIIWTGLSMAGGLVVFSLLVRTRSEEAGDWFTVTGVAHSALGLLVALAFLLLGPTGIPGMQVNPGEAPKVAALAFEANLFASMLGAMAPFAIERYRSRRDPVSAVSVVMIFIGFGLGVTRGAYIGLGVGLIVYLGLLAYRSRYRADSFAIVPIIAVALLLAPSVAVVSLPLERTPGSAFTTPSPDDGGTSSPTEVATSGRPSVSPASTRAPAPTPAPTPTGTTDTLSYRANRIPIALRDLRESPIIGLGAATYGQRHLRTGSYAGAPDYIAMLALVALYESGLVGALALALGFAFALRLLLRSGEDHAGAAAAYAASIVTLLVAYQATNAIFFSINWIILGAGLALAVRARRGQVLGAQ